MAGLSVGKKVSSPRRVEPESLQLVLDGPFNRTRRDFLAIG
jgi:hypothetical protein